MIDIDEFPKARLFAAHGVEFLEASGNELIGDCPFTGKEKKFYVNRETGAWHSKTLGVGGGPSKFLQLTQESYRGTKGIAKHMAKLAADRKIPQSAFKEWGFGWNGKSYTLAVRDAMGRTQDIRTYDMERKQMRSTAGCKVGLLGAHRLKDRPGEPVYLCEGEWDAIALHWLLRSLGKPGVVLGLPGAGTFKPEWTDLLQGRVVHTLYDHDDAGEQGELLAQRRLNGKIRQLTFVHWPDELPSGFDTRDWIVYGAVDRSTPEICLEKMLARFDDTPRKHRSAGAQKKIVLKKTPSRTVTLKEVHEVFRKWLFLPNCDAVDVTLSVAFSMAIEGPPLWMFLVAPPGGAKTATLMSLMQWQGAFITSSLTPHALISGASMHGGSGDPSLIPRLNGKLLVIKDFTPVLAMRDMDQGEIFGIMRDAYDGHCGKIFGNGIERSYESRFSAIAGVTPRIYDLGEGHASMGERWLKFNMGDNLQHNAEEEIIARAIDNVDRNTRMQKELCEIVTAFLESPRGPMPTLPPHIQLKLIALARFGARIRGTVTKDFRGEHIIGRPFAEVGSRLGIQLSKYCRANAWIHGRTEVNDEDYRMAVKIMLDTVSQRQEDVVRAIFKMTRTEGEWISSQDLANNTNYPHSTIRRMLEDMLLLQVLQKRGTTFRYSWRLSPYIEEALRIAEVYTDPANLTRRAAVVFRLRRRPAKPD